MVIHNITKIDCILPYMYQYRRCALGRIKTFVHSPPKAADLLKKFFFNKMGKNWLYRTEKKRNYILLQSCKYGHVVSIMLQKDYPLYI